MEARGSEAGSGTEGWYRKLASMLPNSVLLTFKGPMQKKGAKSIIVFVLLKRLHKLFSLI